MKFPLPAHLYYFGYIDFPPHQTIMSGLNKDSVINIIKSLVDVKDKISRLKVLLTKINPPIKPIDLAGFLVDCEFSVTDPSYRPEVFNFYYVADTTEKLSIADYIQIAVYFADGGVNSIYNLLKVHINRISRFNWEDIRMIMGGKLFGCDPVPFLKIVESHVIDEFTHYQMISLLMTTADNRYRYGIFNTLKNRLSSVTEDRYVAYLDFFRDSKFDSAIMTLIEKTLFKKMTENKWEDDVIPETKKEKKQELVTYHIDTITDYPPFDLTFDWTNYDVINYKEIQHGDCLKFGLHRDGKWELNATKIGREWCYL